MTYIDGMKPQQSFLLAVLLLITVPTAHAGWPCSIDHAYPEVSELRVADGKLVAILGSRYLRITKTVGPNGRERQLIEHPHLSMSSGGSWASDGFGDQPEWWDGSGPQCIDAPQDPDAAWKAAYGDTPPTRTEDYWFDQSVTSCASDGNSIWGGISFYDGEGGWGVGGLVKQDLESGLVEFIHPPKLRKRSTGPLAHFAGKLWFGQTWFGECGGPHSGTGLKRLRHYEPRDWYTVEEVPAACGFAVRDFQEFDGALWVATELGLSKLVDEDGLVWTNFVPDLAEPELFREIDCDDLYTELLTSDEFANIEGFDIGNAFDIFWERLSKLRPKFTRRYMRELHDHSVDQYPGKINLAQ